MTAAQLQTCSFQPVEAGLLTTHVGIGFFAVDVCGAVGHDVAAGLAALRLQVLR